MSDVQLIKALALQHGCAQHPIIGSAVISITNNSANKIAEAIYAAGFRMVDGSAARLGDIETRLARIEGYMVIPGV